MKAKNKSLDVVVIAFLFLTACGDDIDVAVAVSLTQTATVLENAAPDLERTVLPTPEPIVFHEERIYQEEVEVEIEWYPLTPQECDSMAISMNQTLNLMVSTENVPVETSWSEEFGDACQMTAHAYGDRYTKITEPSDALRSMLESEEWTEFESAPCLSRYGGEGTEEYRFCYNRETKTCETMVSLAPIKMELCEGGALDTCLESLASEQQLYTVQLTCAQRNISKRQFETGPFPEAIPVFFTDGATSAQVRDSVESVGLNAYSVTAIEGQEMIVNLRTSGEAAMSVGDFYGIVEPSNYAGGTSWSGELPLSQDYFVYVFSLWGTVDYTLDITLLPISDSAGE